MCRAELILGRKCKDIPPGKRSDIPKQPIDGSPYYDRERKWTGFAGPKIIKGARPVSEQKQVRW